MLQVTESAATTLADTRSEIGIPDHGEELAEALVEWSIEHVGEFR